MQDKDLMQDILLLEKGACDLYMHGTIEASTKSIHDKFSQALTSSLSMQSRIYDQMAANGWYKTDQAQPQQIDTVRQKFENQQTC